MSIGQMDSPHQVMATLQAIEHDLAERQNAFESAAQRWHEVQPDIRKAWASALLASTKGTVAEKRAEADIAACLCDGIEFEAEYEALKAVMRVLETRATINMSILKAQSRV